MVRQGVQEGKEASMKDAKRIDALRDDILDYQRALGRAQDAKHQVAADIYQELIDEDKRFIACILNDGMVPA